MGWSIGLSPEKFGRKGVGVGVPAAEKDIPPPGKQADSSREMEAKSKKARNFMRYLDAIIKPINRIID